jgi:hypothetical protein
MRRPFKAGRPGSLQHGLVLFTRDAHFGEIEGLLTAPTVDELLP